MSNIHEPPNPIELAAEIVSRSGSVGYHGKLHPVSVRLQTPNFLSIQAMAEASSMVSQGFRSRSVIRKEPWPAWTTRDPLLQFSWVVLLALTPRTLVLSSSDEGITLHVETSR